MNQTVYERAIGFKKRYPFTVAWRLKSHCKIISTYLNPGEEVKYVFVGQRGNNSLDIISTYVFALTNKRILMAQKRLLFGHFYKAITPDMFNDIGVTLGLFWGRINIDTVKEVVHISNLQRSCLDEIETNVTEYMMREKRRRSREVTDN